MSHTRPLQIEAVPARHVPLRVYTASRPRRTAEDDRADRIRRARSRAAVVATIPAPPSRRPAAPPEQPVPLPAAPTAPVQAVGDPLRDETRRCVCGCSALAHAHYSSAEHCATCGRRRCPSFRPRGRYAWVLVGFAVLLVVGALLSPVGGGLLLLLTLELGLVVGIPAALLVVLGCGVTVFVYGWRREGRRQ